MIPRGPGGWGPLPIVAAPADGGAGPATTAAAAAPHLVTASKTGAQESGSATSSSLHTVIIHFMSRSVPSCTLQYPVNFWEMALAYQLDAISQDPKNSRFLEPNALPLALVMDLDGTVNQ
jgi:hypothetical protein